MFLRACYFVTSVVLATATVCFSATPERDWVEVKQYACSSVEKRDQLVQIFDTALIPALNRYGAKKVGVFFTDTQTNDNVTNYNTSVFVVTALGSLETLAALESNLLADKAFMQQAAQIFTAQMNDPLFSTQNSAIFHCFAQCPSIQQPTTSPDRLLQLRIYNSYTAERNAKKIEMFQKGGEIGLFRKCGLNPVFFGEAVAGEHLPNLTYMLAFENKAAQVAAWTTFKAHPEWLKLKADLQYKDTANKIINIVLRPSKGSQL